MFAILFEVLLIEIQEEIYHFAGWEGGGVEGRKNCDLNFYEQIGVSYFMNSSGCSMEGTLPTRKEYLRCPFMEAFLGTYS